MKKEEKLTADGGLTKPPKSNYRSNEAQVFVNLYGAGYNLDYIQIHVYLYITYIIHVGLQVIYRSIITLNPFHM